jgi:hypothetical protein
MRPILAPATDAAGHRVQRWCTSTSGRRLTLVVFRDLERRWVNRVGRGRLLYRLDEILLRLLAAGRLPLTIHVDLD